MDKNEPVTVPEPKSDRTGPGRARWPGGPRGEDEAEVLDGVVYVDADAVVAGTPHLRTYGGRRGRLAGRLGIV